MAHIRTFFIYCHRVFLCRLQISLNKADRRGKVVAYSQGASSDYWLIFSKLHTHLVAFLFSKVLHWDHFLHSCPWLCRSCLWNNHLMIILLLHHLLLIQNLAWFRLHGLKLLHWMFLNERYLDITILTPTCAWLPYQLAILITAEFGLHRDWQTALHFFVFWTGFFVMLTLLTIRSGPVENGGFVTIYWAKDIAISTVLLRLAQRRITHTVATDPSDETLWTITVLGALIVLQQRIFHCVLTFQHVDLPTDVLHHRRLWSTILHGLLLLLP